MLNQVTVTVIDAIHGETTDLVRRVGVVIKAQGTALLARDGASWLDRNSFTGQMFRRSIDAVSSAMEALEVMGDATPAESVSCASKYLTAAMAYTTAAYRMVAEDCADFHHYDFRAISRLIADLMAVQALACALTVEATLG
jgi:hypothetical protein